MSINTEQAGKIVRAMRQIVLRQKQIEDRLNVLEKAERSTVIADIVEERLAQRLQVSVQAAMQDGGF